MDYATAALGNVPIYLWGLGTATPFNTVSVRSRVDGQIMHVYYKEGQEVAQGEPLVDIDPKPFEAAVLQAKGQLDKDSATKMQAEADLRRFQESPGAISEQQIAQQKATIAQYAGVIESDQAALQTAQLNVAYSHISAPLSGRIGLRSVDEGNIVHASDSTGIAVITQLHPIAVVFPLREDSIAQVLSQLKAKKVLSVDAYDQNKTNILASGVLEAVDNQVDVETGTVKLKARFENPDNALFPNQFVNACLLIETLENAVLVPVAAVQRGPDNTFVYVINADSTVDIRNVVVGPARNDEVAITSGLSAGERVVTNGIDKLVPKMKVVPGSTTRPTRSGAATRPNGRQRDGSATTRSSRRAATGPATISSVSANS